MRRLVLAVVVATLLPVAAFAAPAPRAVPAAPAAVPAAPAAAPAAPAAVPAPPEGSAVPAPPEGSAVPAPRAVPAPAPSATTTRDLPLNAAEAALRLREADDAFLAGRFEEALDAYGTLVAAGFGTADVLYNRGNAASHTGRLGEAVLAYERALRLDPRHEDARANLALARRRNVDKLVGTADGPNFFERVARVTPSAPVTWGFAAAWVLLFALLILRRATSAGRTLAGLLAVVTLVVGLGAGALLGVVAWHREQVREAVVMQAAAPVRKGPAPRFETAFEIHEGLTVRVLQLDGPYARVRLTNGLEGWILRRALEVI